MKKIISADNTFFSRSETGLIFLIAVILFPIWMLYLLLFLFMSEWQQSLSLVYATENILPLAILGMLVPRVCRALPWRPEDRVSFFITHTGIGILFATFGAAGAMALFSVYLQMIDAQMTIFDYDPRVLSWQFFVAFLCYIAIASASYVTYTIEQLREEEFKRLTADRLLTSTELKALKAQLNPHFLFNTLHSLITLTKRDAEAAAAGLEHFADLMRYIMRSDRNEKVTLSEELDFIDD
ncbi:MAG: histidine kinase, partial [Gammaproteobacteria bacterium]|nr:histidine kinase [Gammaproteobacteria bacterium]